MQLSELTKVVHTVVLENSIPTKALADEIGKPYPTLLREINPNDKGAKLGVETFFAIMLLTGDITALQYMAELMGYAIVLKESGAEDSAMNYT